MKTAKCFMTLLILETEGRKPLNILNIDQVIAKHKVYISRLTPHRDFGLCILPAATGKECLALGR